MTTSRSRPTTISSLTRRNTRRPPTAGPTCGLCHQPIADAYYEIGGKVFCATCRGRIEQSFRGGSRLGRVLKAFVFGSAAALAGGALYYAIIRTTGINLGLIAVLVGFMVGRAVRAGSGNRGGLFYQFLAVFLTYSSIVAMYLPFLVEDVAQTRARKGRASERGSGEGRCGPCQGQRQSPGRRGKQGRIQRQ